MTRSPIYAHDFASVPSRWEDLVTPDDWARDTITVQKDSMYVQVSREFAQDYEPLDWNALLRTPTWAEREANVRYMWTIRYRLSEAWRQFRRRLSDRLYPEREYD